MPRQAGIDAPGALHHIICRGIERRNISRDNTDRNRFPSARYHGEPAGQLGISHTHMINNPILKRSN